PWLDPDRMLMPDSPASPRPRQPLFDQSLVDPKSVRFFLTTLPGSGNDLGLTEMDITGTAMFPRAEGMWLAPGFGMVFTDGPVRTDLPPQLYNARLEVGYKH